MQKLKQWISPSPFLEKCKASPAQQQQRLGAGGEAPEETLPERLHRQTFVSLRLAMAVIAVLLPIVLFLSANLLPDNRVEMQSSLSAFYYTDMRNVFVGALFAIGICLYVYKGYNNLENNGLTAAGLFLFGVALFPTAVPEGSSPSCFSVIHNICAIAFFGLIAVVCIFARPNGLRKPEEYRIAYSITAGLMILVLAAAVPSILLDKVWGVGFPISTFWIETAAMWVFTGYWCVKSRELRGVG